MCAKKMCLIIPVVGLCLVLTAPVKDLLAACDQPDAPDCACFDSTGDWDAGGPGPSSTIQEVALDTLGTKESCHQPSPPVNDDCGKPYYQMILGMNTEAGALGAAYALTYGTPGFADRMEWCSETVSYWHRETGIPYTLGYRNEWHEGWQNYTVSDMRTWYETEEAGGARGRWIESGDIDYHRAVLGETIPTPGAYMAISCYYPNPSGHWCADIDKNHSLMVDEVWIHKNAHGDVFRVEATFLEGNSGRQVKNSRRLDDLFSLTIRGSQWLSYNNGSDGVAGTNDDYGVKIYGFGIALDSSGNPIYDSTRLHEVEHPELRYCRASARAAEDERWNTLYLPYMKQLSAYAKSLRANGGAKITCSPPSVDIRKTPDGKTENWVFPDTLKDVPVVIELDYLNPYPFPIKGIILFWDPSFIPLGYQVDVAGDDHKYAGTTLADMKGFQPLKGNPTPIPVRAKITLPQKGIRYLKLTFPKGTFTQKAILRELTVDYPPGPPEDTAEAPEDISLFVDVRPGLCPNVLRSGSPDSVAVAILGSENMDVRDIEAPNIKLNGVVLTPQSIIRKDVGTPFIGSDPYCHTLAGDGFPDLVLTYKTADLMDSLGLEKRKGETVPIIVTGTIKRLTSVPFVGQDFVRVNPAPALPQLLLLGN